MKAFTYINAKDLRHASELLAAPAGRNSSDRARVLAGGQDLLGELKDHIIEPEVVVNIKTIKGLDGVKLDGKGLTLGALVTLDTVSDHARIKQMYPGLAQAALSVGSPQIRNQGTVGGNLCQRPRCWYYRDETIKCLKKGGTMCYAAEDDGDNKYNAILGGGPSYIVHPSDLAPALVALNAVVRYGTGAGKAKEVAAEEFFILPDRDPTRETVLAPNEIVTEVYVPAPARGTRSVYLKFREKDSFDWAVVSVAATGVVENGVIRNPRIVLGGVAPKPWRSKEAEMAVDGKSYSAAVGNQAAEAALKNAEPLSKNAYKVPLAKVMIRRALEALVNQSA